jgi:hypothetical protein
MAFHATSLSLARDRDQLTERMNRQDVTPATEAVPRSYRLVNLMSFDLF